ncbi:MAG: diacylglycerol kinase family protein [Anaeromyxobacter sp.]
MKPWLIVNPESASGRTGRHFDKIASAVRSAVGEFECAFTKARGDGKRLAQEALAAGGKFVVAVGGDGTASEVIDGLLDEGRLRDPDSTFGFIPRGTGGDLRRTLGLAENLHEAARALAGERTVVADLGRVAFRAHDGTSQLRHFANVAGCGISGAVSSRIDGLKFTGPLSYMLASAGALIGWSDPKVRWRIDGGEWHEEGVTALSVCNGRFFGGGMKVAPDARMDDGLFDVVIWKGFGLVDLVTKRSTLYDGTHVKLPNTRVFQGRTVEIEPVGDAEALLDVDGEHPGRAPARFDLLPKALKIRLGSG